MLASKVFLFLTLALATPTDYPIRLELEQLLDSNLASIRLVYSRQVKVLHTFTYGTCSSQHLDEGHHTVANHAAGDNTDRLIWPIPESAEEGDCLTAWAEKDGAVLGRSGPLKFRKNGKRGSSKKSKKSITMTPENGFDIEGPWFNGVSQLKNGDPSVDVTAAKQKEIAIVGAGMSGLMTFLILHESGFKNVKIIEGSNRLGGRIYTDYLEGGPFDYQYQEMGAMRIPSNTTHRKTNRTMEFHDQKMVFQLAEELNELNKNHKKYKIDFIPFVQSCPNCLYYYDGIRKPDGKVPTITEIAEDPILVYPEVPNPEVERVQAKVAKITSNPDHVEQLAGNIFEAYKDFMRSGPDGLGGDSWSEFAYIHNHLNQTLNITDQASPGLVTKSLFFKSHEVFIFVNPEWQTNWFTVDGGLSRIPEAFRPLLKNNAVTGQKVERVEYNPKGDGKVKLMSKKKYTDAKYQEETYDYAIISAPFTAVRRWRMPRFSSTLSSAIKYLEYGDICKVALQFSTRFWEKFDNPIFGGGATSTDIPGIGIITYPSFNMNTSGPAVVIASYATFEQGRAMSMLPEDEYVQYVVNAMAEIHGEVAREQYTGKYSVKCWNTDQLAGGAFADPSIGQQTLYLPSYFNTENNIIFVGEHTSYTHAWVSSALESGVRGGVQLLLELGLVDEAKAATEKWMGRWMKP